MPRETIRPPDANLSIALASSDLPPSSTGLGRDFLIFLVATSLGTIATACIRFALSWHIVKVTGSATLFASIIAASHFAEVYSKPLLAPLGDCFRRLRVLRWSFLASFLLAVALVVAVLEGPFSAFGLASILVAMSVVNGLRDPAAAALVPNLVAPEQLTQAQSLRSTVASAIGLAGSILGGLLTAATQATAAILAGCCLIALASALALAVRARSDAGTQTSLKTFASTWHRRTLDGLRATWKTRAERLGALAAALINMGITPLTTLVMPLWVIQGLKAGPTTLAWFETALGVGIIAGSYWGPKHFNRWLGRPRASVLGPLAMGLAIVVAAFQTNVWVIAALMLACGFFFTLLLVNGSTLRAVATPNVYRARMIGGFAFIATCMYPFVSQATGYLVESTSVEWVVALCGLFIMAAGVLVAFNRDAQRLWSQPDADIAQAYAKLYPDAFPADDRR